MKAKKLLAILLSLALLVGLMPAAGLVLGGAAETVDLSEKVIKVDFTAGAGDDAVDSSKWCLSVYNLNSPEVKDDTDFKTDAQTNGAYYTFSFDYYLESATYVDADLDTSSSTSLDWPGGYCNYVSGDKVLQPGYHSFTLTEVRTNTNGNMQTLPSFQNIAEDAVLYVWNLKVTLNGRQITAQSAASGVKDVYYYSANTTYTTASITNDKTLEDYDWAFLPNADGSVKVQQVYVDQAGGTGSDETGDGSESKPYASLYKAMQAIESSLYLEGEIIIVGNYTNADQYEMIGGAGNYTAPTAANPKLETADYTKPVTIRGAVGASTNNLYTGTNMWIFGPTTFDDLTVQSSASSASTLYFFGRHNEVTFGSKLKLKGSPRMFGGRYNPVRNPLTEKQAMITLDASAVFNTLSVGNRVPHSSPNAVQVNARTIPGVTYVQNAGTVYSLRIGTEGGGANNTGGGDIYTGDVNIIINGGTIGKSGDATTGFLPDKGMYTDTTTNVTQQTDYGGNAVQIIFNNGTGMTSENNLLPDAKAIADRNGYLYLLKCAAGGSQLAVTDEAGTYTVANPNYIAVATDGTNTYRSENGTLTVPAGTYTVTWEAAEFFTVYVDDSGDDANSGVSTDAPFKTLLKAVQTIATSGAKAGVINVVDTLTTANAFAMTTATGYTNHTQMHTVPITIQGANGTESVLSIEPTTYGLGIYGDLTIDNITVNGTAGYKIYCHKYNFAFGPKAVVNNSPDIRLGYHGATNTQKPTAAPTEPTVLTLYDGTYTRITLGNHGVSKDSYSIASQFAGVNYTMHSGKVTQLQIGHIGVSTTYTAGNIYTDDVNITVNGGDITQITLDDTGTNTFPTTFCNNALQFILNNGTTLTATLPTAEAVAAMGGVLYVLNGDEGVYLTATEEAGVYAVEDGKIAVAKNGDVVVAVSRGGKLTVPAGTYDVTYVETAPYTYDEENGTVTVNEDVTVDFAGMPHKAVDGALFKGYVDGEGNPAAATLTAGAVLTAQYVENWNTDTDGDGKGDSFNVIKTQLREATADKKQALRFIVQLDKSVLESLDTVEYGTVLLPNEILFLEELALGKVYGYDVGSTTLMYKAATVQGVNIYRNGNTYIQYTAALTGIAEKSYLTAYAARGYLTYTDLNSVERTVYTDNTNASSLNEVAEKLLEIDPADATASVITKAAKDYAESQIESTAAPLTPSNAAGLLYGSAENTFSANVDANGVYTTADGREIKYTANGVNSTVVREIVIDTFGDNANVNDTVIAQLTDLHINYANDEDMLNEYTKFSWENRLNMNSWNLAGGEHHSIGWHEKALKYATATSDQVVITGDLIDYYSLGNMQIVERLITEPYSNALMVVGNHDIDSVVNDSGSENIPTDDYFESNNKAYYDQIQRVWNNNVYYTSKVVGKEVMVIQLDNGRDTFRDEQVPLLEADLALAREKGYTVLLFMHIPFQWNSAELIYGDNLNANGLEKADGGATEQVYDLITANGDLVRGIFAGHVHDDIYSTVPATYVENGVTKNTTIPQFTLRGGFVAGGNVLKITVKDVADVDMTQKTTIEPVEGIDNGGVELYRLGDPETGLTVMEKTLNVGLGEGNELEIVQFNDTHLSASAPKTFANWNACIDYAQDNADYFVLNGDLVDTLNATTLGFVQDQLSIYDNCMAVMGNHEWFPKPCEDGEYDIIQQYWKNDVYYSSVVLKDKVMLISMDNSRFDSTDNTVAAFTADQLTKLTADLETAKAKGYAVLLFVHVPLGTNLTEGDATANFYTQNQNDAYYGNGTWNFNTNSPSIHHGDATTAAVCQKIADNADIIKGVFSAHYHSDFYVEIQGTNGVIPQYVNGAAKCDTGNVLKIVLK